MINLISVIKKQRYNLSINAKPYLVLIKKTSFTARHTGFVKEANFLLSRPSDI